MASEILQRVCPREASLLSDRCVSVKVRLRYVNMIYTRMETVKFFDNKQQSADSICGPCSRTTSVR